MNISFSLTTAQVRNRTKTVTRRLGWKNLMAGQTLTAVVKGMGLKRGEHPEVLGKIKVLNVRREPLEDIYFGYRKYSYSEMVREGFPGMSEIEFVAFFCKHNKCTPATVITRIEFEYL